MVKNHNLEYKDAIKKCAETWKVLSESDQKQYKEIATKDGIRYDRELKEFNKTGFFTKE